MDRDWWPAEAQLIYSHGFSQPHQVDEEAAANAAVVVTPPPEHHDQHHRQQHQSRDSRKIQWSRNRTRSSSLATVAPPRLPTMTHRLQQFEATTSSSAAAPRMDIILARSFATTGHHGGVSSRGDSLLSRDDPTSSSQDSVPRHLVLTGGTPGSGRSALVRQFFSSDYTHGYEDTAMQSAYTGGGGAGLDVVGAASDELEVQVDDWCTRLVFDDPAVADTRRWEELGTQQRVLHAFLVVYSVVDAASFSEARQLLKRLDQCDATKHHVIILVANKTDLVRARQVSTAEGRHLAQQYDCKFIECSGGMNHKVDELLAGVATQLRVHGGGEGEEHQHQHHQRHGFLNRLLHRHSRSCQDLFK